MRRPLYPLPFLFALASACSPLQTILPDECGNGVIDSELNEDCDTFPHNDFECVTEGEWACSYKCDGKTCPDGYGCGVDGVCRRPGIGDEGGFEPDPFADIPTEAQELLTGDFDGDGRADVVGIEPGHLKVYFLGSSGIQQTDFASLPRPSVGKLGTLSGDESKAEVDPGDDLVLPLNLGIGALIAGSDRTFEAKPYASLAFDKLIELDIPGAKQQGQIIDALPIAIDALPATGPINAGDEMAALVAFTVDGKQALHDGAFIDFASDSPVLFTVKGGPPSNLAGPPVIGRFDSTPCNQIGFPLKGQNHLTIYKTCSHDNTTAPYDWSRYPHDEEKAVMARIDLQGGAINGPTFTFDVNGDKLLDLLITTSSVDQGVELRVAYGTGNGVFDSTPPATQQTAGDNKARLYATLASKDEVNGHVPLALADLNRDNVPDVVNSRQVLFGSKSDNAAATVTFAVTYASLRTWDEAVIADVNGNGFPDVVASALEARDIDVLSGNPSNFVNPLRIPTSGKVAHLTAGDYDGDLVDDIAFRDAQIDTKSRLMIAYGRAEGGPAEPVQIGTFPAIDRIVSGNVHAFGSDNISDLGVTTGNLEAKAAVDSPVEETIPAIKLSLLPGAANRFIVAPFFLTDLSTGTFDVPLQTALGTVRAESDEGGTHNDLAVLAEAPIQSDIDIISTKGLREASRSLRLWALFGAGEGEFSEAHTATCRLSEGPFFSPGQEQALAIVAPGVTAKGEDGTVFLSAPYVQISGEAPKETVVVRAIVEEVGFHSKVPGECAERKQYLTDPGELLYRVKMVDLNQNGMPELIAIKKRYNADQLAGRLSGHPVPDDDGKLMEPGSSELVVFWDSTKSGAALAPYVVPGPAYMKVDDYTIADADSDHSKGILLVGSAGQIRYVLGPDGHSLSADIPFADENTPSQPVPSKAGLATAVLIIDADGDGVKDLVTVKDGATLQYFKGRPKVLRKGPLSTR